MRRSTPRERRSAAIETRGVERISVTTYEEEMRIDRLIVRRAAAAMLVLVAATLGCSRSTPPGQGNVTVTDITLGRNVASDDTIDPDARTNSFWLNDTFYVSVATDGAAPSATLLARWTYQDGTVAAEVSKTITPSGPTNTALQAPSPESMWKPGDYKVEIFLDGASVATRELSARG